jgi:hypothetical protein
VGRKPKNRFVEGTIAFEKGTELKIYDVKLPFSVKVTYKAKVSEKLDGSPKYAESEMYVTKPLSEKKMIRKEIQKMGYKVVKIEAQTVKFSDLCPQCFRSGVPKIARKDTSDNRNRTWRNKVKKSRTKRPDEFWLVYSHKEKPKKCRIQQAVNTPYPAFKKNLRKNIDISKYYFPQVIGLIKKKKGFKMD